MLNNEKCWERLINKNGEEFRITTKSELDRSVYFLYKITDSGWKKISKNSNPFLFDEIVFSETED